MYSHNVVAVLLATAAVSQVSSYDPMDEWDHSAAPPAFLRKNQVLREHVQSLNAFQWGKWTWSQRLDAINEFEAGSKKVSGGTGVDTKAGHGWYYFNENTGASQYERPKQLGHPDPKNGNRVYWQDPQTGQSVWEPPVQWAWTKHVDKDKHNGQPYYYNSRTKETAWERPDDSAWERVEKPHYWWNEVTGKTQNERPAELGHEDKNHPGTLYWADPATGQTTWEKPKIYDWHTNKEMHNGEAREYYFNPHTKETVWEKPAVMGWKRLSRTDKFWFNSVNKKSQWERPAEVGLVSEDPNHKGSVYWVDPQTKRATWEKPRIWDWLWAKADQSVAATTGQSHFYFNRHDKRAQWDQPESVAWQELPVQLEDEDLAAAASISAAGDL